jgi:predicted secreted protein
MALANGAPVANETTLPQTVDLPSGGAGISTLGGGASGLAGAANGLVVSAACPSGASSGAGVPVVPQAALSTLMATNIKLTTFWRKFISFIPLF